MWLSVIRLVEEPELIVKNPDIKQLKDSIKNFDIESFIDSKHEAKILFKSTHDMKLADTLLTQQQFVVIRGGRSHSGLN